MFASYYYKIWHFSQGLNISLFNYVIPDFVRLEEEIDLFILFTDLTWQCNEFRDVNKTYWLTSSLYFVSNEIFFKLWCIFFKFCLDRGIYSINERNTGTLIKWKLSLNNISYIINDNQCKKYNSTYNIKMTLFFS